MYTEIIINNISSDLYIYGWTLNLFSYREIFNIKKYVVSNLESNGIMLKNGIFFNMKYFWWDMKTQVKEVHFDKKQRKVLGSGA